MDKRRSIRQLAGRTNPINVLTSEFRDQRLALADFFSVFNIPNKDKLFTNFELVGPGNLALLDCHLVPPLGVYNCQFVVVRPDAQLTNVVSFQDCRFVGGKFVQCTFFVSPEQLKEIRDLDGMEKIEAINYESKGEVLEIQRRNPK